MARTHSGERNTTTLPSPIRPGHFIATRQACKEVRQAVALAREIGLYSVNVRGVSWVLYQPRQPRRGAARVHDPRGDAARGAQGAVSGPEGEQEGRQPNRAQRRSQQRMVEFNHRKEAAKDRAAMARLEAAREGWQQQQRQQPQRQQQPEPGLEQPPPPQQPQPQPPPTAQEIPPTSSGSDPPEEMDDERAPKRVAPRGGTQSSPRGACSNALTSSPPPSGGPRGRKRVKQRLSPVLAGAQDQRVLHEPATDLATGPEAASARAVPTTEASQNSAGTSHACTQSQER